MGRAGVVGVVGVVWVLCSGRQLGQPTQTPWNQDLLGRSAGYLVFPRRAGAEQGAPLVVMRTFAEEEAASGFCKGPCAHDAPLADTAIDDGKARGPSAVVRRRLPSAVVRRRGERLEAQRPSVTRFAACGASAPCSLSLSLTMGSKRRVGNTELRSPEGGVRAAPEKRVDERLAFRYDGAGSRGPERMSPTSLAGGLDPLWTDIRATRTSRPFPRLSLVDLVGTPHGVEPQALADLRLCFQTLLRLALAKSRPGEI